MYPIAYLGIVGAVRLWEAANPKNQNLCRNCPALPYRELYSQGAGSEKGLAPRLLGRVHAGIKLTSLIKQCVRMP